MSQCFCQKCLWQPEEQQDTDAQLEAATAKEGDDVSTVKEHNAYLVRRVKRDKQRIAELESQVKRLEAERDELKQELADADLLHTGMCSEREALEADRDKYKRKSEHLWRAMSVLDVKTEDIERAILLTIEEERP
jgi:SMC interacting uncharacterized protein involved in chromosome segregation